MADPRKISRLRRGLARGAVWLAIITSICYVTLFEPRYDAHTVCDKATWTRVVVDPPLSGVEDPILIGSNAGYLFVISDDRCNTRGTRQAIRRNQEDRSWTSIASDLFDRGWEYVSDRWNFLWSNGEASPPEPPTGWFDRAWGYVSGRWNFLLGRTTRLEIPPAVVVPLSRVLCMYEVDAGNDRKRVPCKAAGPKEPATTEQQATLLPVHLLLHFRNAQLSEPNGGLSGSGVDLEPLHKRMLTATVNTLRRCADQENPVRIRPYGFASSKPFAGRDDTNDLNVMAANRRARAVYKALNENGRLDGSHVNVEEPPRWDTFAAMVKERDACIESPSGERGRDPFFDRVVVLDLQTPGRCAPADWAARTIRCSGSEGAGP